MGIWNASIGDVTCSQSISGLDTGYYKVSCIMVVRSDRETTQRLFANTKFVIYGAESEYPIANIDTLEMKFGESVSFADHTFSAGDEGPFKKLSTVVYIIRVSYI